MSVFDAMTQYVGAPALAAQLGEAVRYIPRGSAGLEITAVYVNRQPLVGAADSGFPQYELNVIVNRADIPKPIIGGDKVVLLKRTTDTSATEALVVAISDDAPGLWVLHCR